MDNRLPNAFYRIKESDVKKFIGRCITRLPTERPSAEELLNDDWLNNSTTDDNEFCQSFCVSQSEVPAALTSTNQIPQPPETPSNVSHIKPAAIVLTDANSAPAMSAQSPYYEDIPVTGEQPGSTIIRANTTHGVATHNNKPSYLTTVDPIKQGLGVQKSPRPDVVVNHAYHNLNVTSPKANKIAIRGGEEAPQLQQYNETEETDPEQLQVEGSAKGDEDVNVTEDPKIQAQIHINELDELLAQVKIIDRSSVTSVKSMIMMSIGDSMEKIETKLEEFIQFIKNLPITEVQADPEDEDKQKSNEKPEEIEKYEEAANKLLEVWDEQKEGIEMWVKSNKDDLKDKRNKTKKFNKTERSKG